MKQLGKFPLILLVFGFLLYGCSQEDVNPVTGNDASPSLAGAVDPHPALETICSDIDTIQLWSEQGFKWCNKCYDMFGGPRTCDGQDSLTSWGNVILMNGLDSMDSNHDQMYDMAENVFVANFTMAAGWFIRTSQSQFSAGNTWQIQNGLIIIQNDWLSTNLNPVENAWQLRKPVSQLPACFDVALRLHVVSLDLFSETITGSETYLWGHNPNSNKPTDPSYSPISPFLTHICPNNCGQTPPPITTSQCVALYVGNTALGTCRSLAAPALSNPVGPVHYAWSSGQTSATINACPVVNTTYTVTVSDNGGARSITNFNVKVINAACGNGNGNNGIHKVTVCHRPPGNPTNVQNICIDWSGVPAHVARFRVAGSNPHQGHDSGCEIGTCGSNPCL